MSCKAKDEGRLTVASDDNAAGEKIDCFDVLGLEWVDYILDHKNIGAQAIIKHTFLGGIHIDGDSIGGVSSKFEKKKALAVKRGPSGVLLP